MGIRSVDNDERVRPRAGSLYLGDRRHGQPVEWETHVAAQRPSSGSRSPFHAKEPPAQRPSSATIWTSQVGAAVRRPDNRIIDEGLPSTGSHGGRGLFILGVTTSDEWQAEPDGDVYKHRPPVAWARVIYENRPCSTKSSQFPAASTNASG